MKQNQSKGRPAVIVSRLSLGQGEGGRGGAERELERERERVSRKEIGVILLTKAF